MSAGLYHESRGGTPSNVKKRRAEQGVEQQPAISFPVSFSFALLSRRCAHFDVRQRIFRPHTTMPFIQIRPETIINTDQISRIRFIPGSRTKAEYRDDFGQKAEIPGTATTVSTSQLAIDFSKVDGDAGDIKIHGDEADRVYAALLEHIQVHQLP